jgi:hypothetical protein
MDRGTTTIALLAATIAVSGCGNDKPKSNANTNAKAASTLPRPIPAPCAAPQFAPPRITHARPNVWSLQYTRTKPPPPSQQGASRTILLVEFPPASPHRANFAPHAKQATIAGHRVSVQDLSSKTPFYSAQWKTQKALYTMVADGTNPTAVKQFIACLP